MNGRSSLVASVHSDGRHGHRERRHCRRHRANAHALADQRLAGDVAVLSEEFNLEAIVA